MQPIKSLQTAIHQAPATKKQVIDGDKLRLIIGVLAFLLPTIMIIGSLIFDNCQTIQSSISAYYHTDMGDVFVGILCGVAICMFAYKGYSSIDAKVANLADLMALGVALFPTSVDEAFTHCLPAEIISSVSWLHYGSAAILFCLLAFFSLVLFTMTGSTKEMTTSKSKRNTVYKICGYGILICVLLIGLNAIIDVPAIRQNKPVFFLEALALALFSISWLTKAEIIFPD